MTSVSTRVKTTALWNTCVYDVTSIQFIACVMRKEFAKLCYDAFRVLLLFFSRTEKSVGGFILLFQKDRVVFDRCVLAVFLGCDMWCLKKVKSQMWSRRIEYLDWFVYRIFILVRVRKSGGFIWIVRKYFLKLFS